MSQMMSDNVSDLTVGAELYTPSQLLRHLAPFPMKAECLRHWRRGQEECGGADNPLSILSRPKMWAN